MSLNQAPNQDRDQQITQVMQQHGTALLRVCFLMLQDEEQARDAVQETFLKAYRRWDSFRGDSDAGTWLMRIAINICKDMKRTAWFRLHSTRVRLEDAKESSFEPQYQDDTVLQAIQALPEKYRVAVLLYYYREMNQEQVARALGIPVSTVKSRLKRAKDRLRTTLKGWYLDE